MSTLKRNEVSKKNPYYISKYRMLEMKYFALQYHDFIKFRNDIYESTPSRWLMECAKGKSFTDVASAKVIKTCNISNYITAIESAAAMTDAFLNPYILQAVTNGTGYDYARFKSETPIPCSRDTFYNLIRKFYYILSELKYGLES